MRRDISLARSIRSGETTAGSTPRRVFYDVSFDAATFMFDPSAYRDTIITPEMVIEHVEHVLAGLEIPEEEFDHRRLSTKRAATRTGTDMSGNLIPTRTAGQTLV